ncbi:RidA family protein [Oryzifoliimicrobium ureilyticus]|uniref:RidA family protein n=1 Tax=Oryzifoliimicrobium ureilyticus TaxID=3113724 RepID=UPI0030762362
MSRFIDIYTDQAPRPAGHYVQAKRVADQLYISGQLPIRTDGKLLNDSDFETQAGQAIDNVLSILKAAGGMPADLVRVTAYIVGVVNWPMFDKVFAERLKDVRPVRTVVPVPELHYGYLVEIDAVAHLAKVS